MNNLPHALKDYNIFVGTKNRKNMKKSVMKQSKYMSKSSSSKSKSRNKSKGSKNLFSILDPRGRRNQV